MVTSSIKQKKIVLMKVSDILNRPTEDNLATLLGKAWNSENDGKAFSQDIDFREKSLSNGDSLVMNEGASSKDGFLGEVLSFEPNGFLIVANKDKSGDRSKLHLRQLQTDIDDNPYKGVTYFYAHKDYILFLDGGVRYQLVSQYLSWMISNTFRVSKGVYVQLDPEIEIDGNPAQLVDATSLEVRPRPISPMTPIEGFIDQQKDNTTETITDKSTTSRILNALSFRYQSFQRYLDETDGAGKIEVQVKIKLKNKNKLVPVSRNLQLATLMDSTTDADFILIGKGGRTKGKLIRANYMADIDYTGSLIDNHSVQIAFSAALKSFIERGCIR